eukprot:GILI01020704.1.p1 GENE.GILI01020704.1~~GILI01020704.1.p1  ORF type:complete len:247 (-),score=32.37 GILI01020704.1:68-754(-)
MKMKATSGTVNVMRLMIDFVNTGIYKIYGPLGRAYSAISNDYPVVGVFFSGVAVAFVPMLLYPYWTRWRDNDPRRVLERERVELCLQKGIDPYPMVRYKEHVHGNQSQLSSFGESDAPPEASYEHRAVEAMRKRSELYAKVMGISSSSEVTSSVANHEDPQRSLDALLALRERERAKFNGNKMVVWQDPVDLAFPKRDDELFPTNSVERKESPDQEKARFLKENTKAK